MPLKALFDGQLINAADLTTAEFRHLAKENAIAKRHRKYLCLCFECGQRTYFRTSHLGTQHFPHNPAADGKCDFRNGTSPEHMSITSDAYKGFKRLKNVEMADTEHRLSIPDSETGKPVVVDVFAQLKSGHKFGLEVQVSPMSAGKALARQENRLDELTGCTWVATSEPSWKGAVPHYQVERFDRTWYVVDGIVNKYEQPLEPFPATLIYEELLGRVQWLPDFGVLRAPLIDKNIESFRKRPTRLPMRPRRGHVGACDRVERSCLLCANPIAPRQSTYVYFDLLCGDCLGTSIDPRQQGLLFDPSQLDYWSKLND